MFALKQHVQEFRGSLFDLLSLEVVAGGGPDGQEDGSGSRTGGTLYAGHSLRAGLATSAAMAGVSERAIMNQTGHKSVTVARRYIRDGSLYGENAAAQVGL